MDPLWFALSYLRRGKYEECIAVCDTLLQQKPSDQAAWAVKCKAVIKQNYIDSIELDEESFAEILMDENAIANVARPGTSLSAPKGDQRLGSDGGVNSYDQALRPVMQSGRPMTGFLRPMSSRPDSSSGSLDIRDALQSRAGISAGARPMTNLGRELRLGTASLSATGALVDVSRLNTKKYAREPGLAIILVDYLLYVEHNPKKALELCAEATKECDFKNWYWKARLGQCYAKLGLLRDAERQYRSSLKTQPIIDTYLELCNVYIRLDLPNTALDLLSEACDLFSVEPRLVLGMARLHDMLNQPKALPCYKKVLVLDAANVEAIACLGSHAFYSDQPEMAIRYYRRLLQMGISSPALWNNIGLSCFYASQFDMALGCFDKALHEAGDEETADIWYNIGHVGLVLGDLGFAYQAFKTCVSVDPHHGEALNNIAVLEMRRQKFDVARACLQSSIDVGKSYYESHYNLGTFFYLTFV